jgi:hypothetical protein
LPRALPMAFFLSQFAVQCHLYPNSQHDYLAEKQSQYQQLLTHWSSVSVSSSLSSLPATELHGLSLSLRSVPASGSTSSVHSQFSTQDLLLPSRLDPC